MHAFSEALSDCVPCDDTKLVKYVPVVSASVGSRSQGKPRQQLPLQKNSLTDSNKSRQRQFVLICQTVNCGQMLSMQLANVILFFSQDVRESISSV